MEIKYLEHSCLLLTQNNTKILFDPGVFSPGWENITDLTAIAITHQHTDHVDLTRFPELIKNNPTAKVIVEAGTAELLKDINIPNLQVIKNQEIINLGDLQLKAFVDDHEILLPQIPRIKNCGYIVGTTEKPNWFYHPGDSLFIPEEKIEILGLPVAAPWMKILETNEYYHKISPKMAIPIHHAIIATPTKNVYFGHLTNFGPTSSEFTPIATGETVTFN